MAMATTSTPKLENFLGGQTMGIPQYECNSTKEAIYLSLDSVFYNQTSCHEANNPNKFNHVQDINQQHLSYYSALKNHELMLEGSKQNQLRESVQLQNIVEDEISGVESSWVSREFHASHPQKSMSPSSQSSCVTSSQQTSPAFIDSVAIDMKRRRPNMVDLEENQKQTVLRKSIHTFGQRTSQYRGVTRFVLFYSFVFVSLREFLNM